MRLLISLTILTLLGCEKQKQQIEKFVFDNTQISSKSIYKYDFDERGRISTAYSTNIIYIAGVPLDSTTYVQLYEYNDKGKIVKVFDSMDSTWQAKFYNEFDSLIADYTINKYSDTTRMEIINYLNKKSYKKFRRILSMKMPENFENIKKEYLRNYDTLSSMTEFVYEDDLHIKTLSFNKNGALTEEVELIYENSQITKTITYSFLGDNKYISETTFYSDNNSDGQDLTTIGIRSDTIGFQKTILQDQGKITIDYIGEFNTQHISYYDKVGRNIGIVLLDFNEKTKTVYSYTYDDKGNMIEESSYKERINMTR